MSLLKQDITKKGQVEKSTCQLGFDNSRNNEIKYKVESICDSRVYGRKVDNELLDLKKVEGFFIDWLLDFSSMLRSWEIFSTIPNNILAKPLSNIAP